MDDGSAINESVEKACAQLRQGDVLDLGNLPLIGSEGLSEARCDLGAAILTQTCDLVQPRRSYVVVAPVIELSAQDASLARRGRMPQYVQIDSDNGQRFVDLTLCATVTKSAVAGSTRLYAGVDQSDSVAVSRFGVQVGRRFSRFAFPDEVQPWFRPLQEKVSKVHDKDSPLGVLLRDIVELRIQSTDWGNPGMQLTLHVIVPSTHVPGSENYDPDDVSEKLIDELNPTGELIDANQIAQRILKPLDKSFSDADLNYLWNMFAEALARLCKPKDSITDPGVLNAVTSVAGLLSTDEEFSLYLFRRTESLDLEHLSAPVLHLAAPPA